MVIVFVSFLYTPIMLVDVESLVYVKERVIGVSSYLNRV